MATLAQQLDRFRRLATVWNVLSFDNVDPKGVIEVEREILFWSRR